MEPWKVYRPVVTDSHHFHEELDPDSYLHSSQNSEALEAQNRAVEGRGRSQRRPGGSK
jgi:hypothetical protein